VIQASLLQLDDYGPWTTTPHPRREMDLQTLQSRLYADVAAFVGSRDGYAFYTRGDNLLAFTNGLDRTAHERLQTSVRNRYPVTLSVGLGTGATPRAAVEAATEPLQAAGSAQDGDRTEVLAGETLAAPDPFDVAHFDVVDATGAYTDSEAAYGAYLDISSGFDALARRLYRGHDALTFFVGGDNAIAVCPPLDGSTYDDAIEHVRSAADVDLRVGVGRARTATAAGMDAKHALERGRDRRLTTVLATDGADAHAE
jgi:GTP cyclohydrolase IIa